MIKWASSKLRYSVFKRCLLENEKSSHSLGERHTSDKELVSRLQKELKEDMQRANWKHLKRLKISSQSTFSYLLQRGKNHIPKDLAMDVYSICNNKKRKRHKCFSTRDRLNKLCYSHNEILLSNEQEETVALPNKPNEPQNNNAEKSQVKEYIIYDCIYIQFWKM